MYRSISESDLLDEYQVPVDNELPDWFKETLYKLGLNTKSPEFEVTTCLHRNASNKIVECRRWTAPERLDKEWIKSGYASDEAIIASSPFMRTELRQMSKRLTFGVVGKDVEV